MNLQDCLLRTFEVSNPARFAADSGRICSVSAVCPCKQGNVSNSALSLLFFFNTHIFRAIQTFCDDAASERTMRVEPGVKWQGVVSGSQSVWVEILDEPGWQVSPELQLAGSSAQV